MWIKKGLPRTMLIDMNSFFASVEQQANPGFRGKPLGVCASLHPTSCIIAASKEAKALGIKTGTLIYKARRICPNISLVPSDPDKYRQVSHGLNKILFDYSEEVESYSIDESFMDLSRSKINPLIVGSEIKRRIKEELGEWLTCSIGIGPNKFIAKLAADLKKPDGLMVIWRENLPAVYQNLKLTDLWGVSYGWQRRLLRLGITNPLGVLNYPVANLIAAFGKSGFYIWQRICGLEEDRVMSSSTVNSQKSFGHSWVLNFRSSDKEKLKPVVMRLAEKAARRMRGEGFKANGLYLSVTLVDGRHFHVSKTYKFSISSGLEYWEQVKNLWKSWVFKREALHIATGFTRLKINTRQLSIFGDKNPELLKSLDYINDKYGEFTIRAGILTQTQGYAPDAIAFGR